MRYYNMVRLTCIDCGIKNTVKPSCLKNGIVDYRCRTCSNKHYIPMKQQDISTQKKLKLLASLYKKNKMEL